MSQSCRTGLNKVGQDLGEASPGPLLRIFLTRQLHTETYAGSRNQRGVKNKPLVTRAVPCIRPALPHGMNENSQGGWAEGLLGPGVSAIRKSLATCVLTTSASLGGGRQLPGPLLQVRNGLAWVLPTPTHGGSYTHVCTIQSHTHLHTQAQAQTHRTQGAEAFGSSWL